MCELSFMAAPMRLWPTQNGCNIIASCSIHVCELAVLLNLEIIIISIKIIYRKVINKVQFLM